MWNARNEAAKLFIITLALFSFYRYTYQWLFSLHGVPRYMNAIIIIVTIVVTMIIAIMMVNECVASMAIPCGRR